MFLDDDFLRPVVVALTSLFENMYPDTFYSVSVLIPGDFKPENKMKIDSLGKKYKNFSIDFFDMGNRYKDMNRSKLGYPAPTYYRLDIAGILTHEKKCIVLEGDQIVRHDLSEMFNFSLDNYYVAGVCQGVNSNKHLRDLGIPDADHYINVGVLIMNLEKIREDMLEEKFLKVVKEKNAIIQKWFADNEVFNIVCYGNIKCLPHKFGYLVNYFQDCGLEEVEDPTIVHFASMQKPWMFPEKTMFHKEFWDYAGRTNLYDEEIGRLKGGVDVVSKADGKIVTREHEEMLERKHLNKSDRTKKEKKSKKMDL